MHNNDSAGDSSLFQNHVARELKLITTMQHHGWVATFKLPTASGVQIGDDRMHTNVVWGILVGRESTRDISTQGPGRHFNDKFTNVQRVQQKQPAASPFICISRQVTVLRWLPQSLLDVNHSEAEQNMTGPELCKSHAETPKVRKYFGWYSCSSQDLHHQCVHTKVP